MYEDHLTICMKSGLVLVDPALVKNHQSRNNPGPSQLLRYPSILEWMRSWTQVRCQWRWPCQSPSFSCCFMFPWLTAHWKSSLEHQSHSYSLDSKHNSISTFQRKLIWHKSNTWISQKPDFSLVSSMWYSKSFFKHNIALFFHVR